MSEKCNTIQAWLRELKRFSFPLKEKEIPLNGIYILFEEGENAHGTDRIVRIGTHTGKNQLRSRLKQHFIYENKDRSIFRKNIGRALLNKTHDSFLKQWELDLTTKVAKETSGDKINFDKQKEIEKLITKYIQGKFTFVVFPIEDKEKRLKMETKIISTTYACKECRPSSLWLGNFSPKEKIRESGLWLVNGLHKDELDEEEMNELKKILKI